MVPLLNIDTDNLKPTTIPKGEQRLIISQQEMKSNKAGTGYILKLTFQVCGGQFANFTFSQQYNVLHPNHQTQAIAEQQIGEIAQAIGVKKVTKSEQLLNNGGQISKPFLAYVDVKDEGEYGLKNLVKKPRRIDGTTPTPQPPVTTPAPDVAAPVANMEAGPWAAAT